MVKETGLPEYCIGCFSKGRFDPWTWIKAKLSIHLYAAGCFDPRPRSRNRETEHIVIEAETKALRQCTRSKVAKPKDPRTKPDGLRLNDQNRV